MDTVENVIATLSLRELREIQDRCSPEVVDQLLTNTEGGDVDISGVAGLELMATIHAIYHQRDDAGWTFEMSEDLPISELVTLFSQGDDDGPK